MRVVIEAKTGMVAMFDLHDVAVRCRELSGGDEQWAQFSVEEKRRIVADGIAGTVKRAILHELVTVGYLL